jgi:hypothetical protein
MSKCDFSTIDIGNPPRASISVPSIFPFMGTYLKPASVSFMPNHGESAVSNFKVDPFTTANIQPPAISSWQTVPITIPSIPNLSITRPNSLSYSAPTGVLSYESMPNLSPVESTFIEDISIPIVIPSVNIEEIKMEMVPINIDISIEDIPKFLKQYSNFILKTLKAFINSDYSENITIDEKGNIKITGKETITGIENLNRNFNEIGSGLEIRYGNKEDTYNKSINRSSQEDSNAVENIIEHGNLQEVITENSRRNENSVDNNIKLFGNLQVLASPYNKLKGSLIQIYNRELNRYRDIFSAPASIEINNEEVIISGDRKVERNKRSIAESVFEKIEKKVNTEIEKIIQNSKEIIEGKTDKILTNYKISNGNSITTGVEDENSIEVFTQNEHKDRNKSYTKDIDLSGLSAYMSVMNNLENQNTNLEMYIPYLNTWVSAIETKYNIKASQYLSLMQYFSALSENSQLIIQRNNAIIRYFESIASDYVSSIVGGNNAKERLLRIAIEANSSAVSSFSEIMNMAKRLSEINEENLRAYSIASSAYMQALEGEVRAIQSKKYVAKAEGYQAAIEGLSERADIVKSQVDVYNIELVTLLEKATAEISIFREKVKMFSDLVKVINDKLKIHKDILDLKAQSVLAEAKIAAKELEHNFKLSLVEYNSAIKDLNAQIQGARITSQSKIDAARLSRRSAQAQVNASVVKATGNLRAADRMANAQICGELIESIGRV